MKQDLILLHGALGSAQQFELLTNELKDEFNVYRFDFSGHGNGVETDVMSIELFTNELIDYIHNNFLENSIVFGYSMGGYVALLAQSIQPNLFSKIITLGTKFHWSPEIAAQEIRMIQPEKIAEKVPKFAEYLSKIQAPKDWKKVMLQTQALMLGLGDNPLLTSETLTKIEIPVLLCLGELDTMVTVEETQEVQKYLENSSFEVVKGIPHPIQMIETKRLVELIKS